MKRLKTFTSLFAAATLALLGTLSSVPASGVGIRAGVTVGGPSSVCHHEPLNMFFRGLDATKNYQLVREMDGNVAAFNFYNPSTIRLDEPVSYVEGATNRYTFSLHFLNADYSTGEFVAQHSVTVRNCGHADPRIEMDPERACQVDMLGMQLTGFAPNTQLFWNTGFGKSGNLTTVGTGNEYVPIPHSNLGRYGVFDVRVAESQQKLDAGDYLKVAQVELVDCSAFTKIGGFTPARNGNVVMIPSRDHVTVTVWTDWYRRAVTTTQDIILSPSTSRITIVAQITDPGYVFDDGTTFKHSSFSYDWGWPSPSPFDDVPESQPFDDAITWMWNSGISTGWDNNNGTWSYRPYNQVLRDQMAAFLFRFAARTDPAVAEYRAPIEPRFVDVPKSHIFYREISWLADAGISTGWNNNDGTRSFRPYQPVLRDQMAAFLFRLAGKYSAWDNAYQAPPRSPFKDVATSRVFYREIAWMEASGISTGWPDGTFRPFNRVLRDQMAAFMSRTSEALGR